MLQMINWKRDLSHIGNEQGSRIPFNTACLEAEAPKYIGVLNFNKRTLGQVSCRLIASLYSKMKFILGSQRDRYILSV